MNPNPLARLGLVIAAMALGAALIVGFVVRVEVVPRGYPEALLCGSVLSQYHPVPSVFWWREQDKRDWRAACNNELGQAKLIMALVGGVGITFGLGMVWAGGGFKSN